MNTTNLIHEVAETNQDSGVKSESMTGKTPTANTAKNECHQDATGAKNTVTTLAEKQQVGSEKARPCHTDVTLASSRTDTRGFYVPSGYGRKCDICGREYGAKRDTSKYCGGACRQQAWLKNHPDVAAAKNAAYRELVKARILASGGEWVERNAR